MPEEQELTIQEQNLRDIANFRLFDDTFLSAVFDKQLPETELLLRIMLGREDLIVTSSKAQYHLSNIYGHEVRLDVLAADKEGKAYNIEVQRLLTGASVQRARFYAAMVDVTLLERGQPYEELPERYTILIAEEDKYQKGLPAYHIENRILELDNAPAGDGGHIIYVNGQYRNTETPIGKLMHDFFCTKPEDIMTPLLRERVYYLKKTEGGQKEMCQIMENRLIQDKIEQAKKIIKTGKYGLDAIAEIIGLPLAVVEELAQQKSA